SYQIKVLVKQNSALLEIAVPLRGGVVLRNWWPVWGGVRSRGKEKYCSPGVLSSDCAYPDGQNPKDLSGIAGDPDNPRLLFREVSGSSRLFKGSISYFPGFGLAARVLVRFGIPQKKTE
ncbi:unnamed protein product, partial [Tuber aestivum]